MCAGKHASLGNTYHCDTGTSFYACVRCLFTAFVRNKTSNDTERIYWSRVARPSLRRRLLIGDLWRLSISNLQSISACAEKVWPLETKNLLGLRICKDFVFTKYS